jgi:hypothetical protein
MPRKTKKRSLIEETPTIEQGAGPRGPSTSPELLLPAEQRRALLSSDDERDTSHLSNRRYKKQAPFKLD